MNHSPRMVNQPSDDSRLAKLEKIRRLSYLWDRAFGIPGTNFRVGIEAIVGLLPIGGDIIGIIMSGYILLQVIQFNLPKTLLARMLFNVLLDAVVGSVPFLGDFFDTTWKANTKNVRLLEAHLSNPEESRKNDNKFFSLLFAGLFLLTVILIALLIIFVRFVTKIIFGT